MKIEEPRGCLLCVVGARRQPDLLRIVEQRGVRFATAEKNRGPILESNADD
jgi:hypothetical protein